MQLCNCIQNHSQPTETAVARIPAAENSRFFIDTTSIELALLDRRVHLQIVCRSTTVLFKLFFDGSFGPDKVAVLHEWF